MADNTITIEHKIFGDNNNNTSGSNSNINVNSILEKNNSLLEQLLKTQQNVEKILSANKSTSSKVSANNLEATKIRAEYTAKNLSTKGELNKSAANSKIFVQSLKNTYAEITGETRKYVENLKLQSAKLKTATTDKKTDAFDRRTDVIEEATSIKRDALNNRIEQQEKKLQEKKQKLKEKEQFSKSGIYGGLAVAGLEYMSRSLAIASNYRMANAQTSGNFAQSTIMGDASGAYGGYKAGLIQNQKQQAISQHSMQWKLTGELIGGVVGGLIGSKLGFVGTAFGAYQGSKAFGAVGDYIADFGNAKTSQQYDVKSAYAQRDAIMSINQWQTSLSRFGGKGEDLAGFQARYGKDQNALGIQTGIAPYLNHAFNKDNLKDVAQGFLKAGFSVNDFARLTMQSAQAMAVSGKGIMEFSKDVIHAQGIYGKGYDLGTNQTALDLQSKYGMNRDTSQNLAYQSIFNPNLMSNVDKYYSNTRASWEQKKALGESLGFNFNKTEQTGHLSGATPAFKKQLAKELHDIDTGDVYGDLLTKLGVGNVGITQARSWLQPEAETLKNGSKRGEDISKNEAQSVGDQILQAIQGGFSKVDNMSVTVTGNMTIVNNGVMSTGSGYMTSVPNYTNSNIPVGKQ